VLLGSGLRISEVLQLDRDQYTGKGFAHVHVEGGQLRNVIPVQGDASQANANRPEKEHIQVTPHVLRHTFLRKLAEAKGMHYAREASGHQSDRYIWRYVKPDRRSLAEAGSVLTQLRV
jgi:integrase